MCQIAHARFAANRLHDVLPQPRRYVGMAKLTEVKAVGREEREHRMSVLKQSGVSRRRHESTVQHSMGEFESR